MRKSLPALILVSGVLACGDGTGPALDGSYQLKTLNGSTLPYDQSDGCCIYQAGSLRIVGSSYQASLLFRNRNTQLEATASESGTVTPGADGSLTFHPQPAELPLGMADGRVSGDTVFAGFGGEGPGSPDQFHGVFVR